MMLECPDCEVRLRKGKCPFCGWTPPPTMRDAAARAEAGQPRRCWVDGGDLADDGYCPKGAGYVLGALCPFACPVCRHPLSWAGSCGACHGTATGRREDWTFPGDRYELVRQHWVKTDDGPRPALSLVDARRLLSLCQIMVTARA